MRLSCDKFNFYAKFYGFLSDLSTIETKKLFLAQILEPKPLLLYLIISSLTLSILMQKVYYMLNLDSLKLRISDQ